MMKIFGVLALAATVSAVAEPINNEYYAQYMHNKLDTRESKPINNEYYAQYMHNKLAARGTCMFKLQVNVSALDD